MLKFGFFVPQGWRLDLPITAPDEQWRLMINVAKRGEELGFDSLWVYDHFHTVPKPLPGRSVFEAWTILAALSQITEKVRLGTLVTCILYRYPTVLAKIVANIDVMSGGRVEFGIGACWYEHEFMGYGIEFPPPGRRIRMLDEALEIIKLMWTRDEVDFEGKYYKIKGALNDPKPLQKPYPPILIGGGGEKLTLRVVAKHADKHHVGGTYEVYKHKLEVLKAHCKAVGRNYNDIVKVHGGMLIIGDDEKIKQVIKETEIFRYRPVTVEGLKKGSYAGTPEEILEKIKKFADLGVREFIFYFPQAYKLKPLEEFAEKILPEARELA